VARRRSVRRGEAGESSRSARRKMTGPVGWLYLVAGIVLVFVAYFVDPALIAALIFFVIGLGLLAAGFGMMGVRCRFLCDWFCDGSCGTVH